MLKIKYTPFNDLSVKNIVDRDLDIIINEFSNFLFVKEIILRGSYFFGEAKFRKLSKNRIELLSDYDIIIVINTLKRNNLQKLILARNKLNGKINSSLCIGFIFYNISFLHRKIDGVILYSKIKYFRPYLVQNTPEYLINQLLDFKCEWVNLCVNNPYFKLNGNLAHANRKIPSIAFLLGKEDAKYEYKKNLEYIKFKQPNFFNEGEIRLLKKQVSGAQHHRFLDQDWFIVRSILKKHAQLFLPNGKISAKFWPFIAFYSAEYIISKKGEDYKSFCYFPFYQFLIGSYYFAKSIQKNSFDFKILSVSLKYLNKLRRHPIHLNTGAPKKAWKQICDLKDVCYFSTLGEEQHS